jgi:hypothetical protein
MDRSATGCRTLSLANRPSPSAEILRARLLRDLLAREVVVPVVDEGPSLVLRVGDRVQPPVAEVRVDCRLPGRVGCGQRLMLAVVGEPL